jgi:hypothetical protein
MTPICQLRVLRVFDNLGLPKNGIIGSHSGQYNECGQGQEPILNGTPEWCFTLTGFCLIPKH